MNHRIPYRNMLEAARQVAIVAGLVLLSSLPAWPQASQVPNAKQQFIGPTGAAYDSGQVFMYVPNTFTKKSTWTGPDQVTQNANPILLDAAGRAKIWGVGSYRQVVKDKNGLQVWDELTIAPPTPSTAAPSGSGDFLPVGTILAIAGYTAPLNYVLAYGQAISRVTYVDALNALTISSTAACVNGNATVTGIASTAQVRVGAPIEASCLASGTTVATIAGPTSVTVTPVATSTGSTTVRIFNYGNGDAVTTFNIPDLRGRVAPGADCIGGVCASRLVTAYYGVGAAAPGSASTSSSPSGSQTLLQPNLPNVVLATAIAAGQGNHQHPPQGSGFGVPAAGPFNWPAGSGGGSAPATADATLPAMVGTTPTGGTNTPFSVIQPSLTVNYAIKVLNGTLPIVGVLSLGGMTGDIICTSPLFCSGQAISLSGTSLAGTLFGNPTGSPTNANFFQINTLSLKGAPDANLDMVLLWDNVCICFKRTTPGAIGSTGVSGVSSINGATGALLLGSGLKVVGSTIKVPSVVSITDAPYNAQCNNVADDTTAIQNAINSGAAVVLFPPGTCLLNAAGLTGVSNQIWQGSGAPVSILKANATPGGELISFTAKSSFEIKDITIDYNNKVPAGTNAALGFNGADTFAVRRIAIIHGNKLGISVSNSSGFTIEDSTISRDATIITLNQAILFTDVAGLNHHFRIQRNNITNWGILNGASNNCFFRENFITNYWYGAGIGAGTGDTCIIEANIITGGKNALDADATRPGGIESNFNKAIIASNIVYGNGGSGIHAGGLYVAVANNLTYNNGTFNLVNPAFQFAGLESRWVDATNNGHYHAFTGNVSFDQTGTQSFGWAAVPAGGGGNEPSYQTLAGNILSGVISPASVTSGIYRSFLGPSLEGSTGVGGTTVNNGTSLIITQGVVGAVLADKVIAGIGVDLQGLSLTAFVSSANTVKAVYYNGTGANVTLGAHTLNVTVLKAASAANY